MKRGRLFDHAGRFLPGYMRKVENFTLKNELGLHARVAAMLVNVSSKYDARISFEKDGIEVDGTSILDILTLACPKGSNITIRAEGADADRAMKEFARLIENKFGED